MGAVGKGNSRTRPAELGYTPPVQNFVNVEATEGSADRARSTSATVIGKWTHAESQGVNSTVYVKGSQDTWEFKDSLTYEHRQSSYEGYVAPPSPYSTFSYSRPSEHTTRGIWTPPDWWEHKQLTIVIIPAGGSARRFTLAWTDPESPFRSSCRIDGSVYARTC
jgi:hypothetical protein